MRGCWRTFWKALDTFKIIGNTKKCDGETWFSNAGMEAAKAARAARTVNVASVAQTAKMDASL